MLTIVAQEPLSPESYKAPIPSDFGIVHTTIEIHKKERFAVPSPSTANPLSLPKGNSHKPDANLGT